MSNINNHGVGMNKINLATDFQELTCEQAAAIQGGGVIQVFTDANFQGGSLRVISSRAGQSRNFEDVFNNSISSIRVLSGEWELATNRNNTGLLLTGSPASGRLFNLGTVFNGAFNDSISSIRSVSA